MISPIPTSKTSRRVLALWLAHLPAERPERAQRPAGHPNALRPRPFAVWAAKGNRRLITATNVAAEGAGIAAGQTVADARALLPTLALAPADEGADRRLLARLAAWCRRFSPWTAPFREHGPGIWLETTGCDHLLGGEDALCRTVLKRLGAAGFRAGAGLASTPGAAYALARTAPAGTARLCPPGEEREALAPLPVATLRLDRAPVDHLDGLGLRCIGDLYPLVADARGRAALARRFPPLLLNRLDQALGAAFEPISPVTPRTAYITRFDAPEPVHGDGTVPRIAARLAAALAPMLARDGRGARRLTLAAFRTDGRRMRLAVGTARPLAEPRAMTELLALALDSRGLDLGPGADGFTLEALATEPLRVTAPHLGSRRVVKNDDHGGHGDTTLAPLVERLSGRLGAARVGRLAPRPHHLPERAQSFTRALDGHEDPTPWGRPVVLPAGTRPLRLLPRPEPLAVADGGGGPPLWFRWRGRRHVTARAEGPERIALDWWRLPGWGDSSGGADTIAGAPEGLTDAVRDYWRVEDTGGARFWLYRAGLPGPGDARWYLHGLFA